MSAVEDLTFMTLNLDQVRTIVQECREGNFRELETLTMLLKARQLTLADVGSTGDELEEFIQRRVENDRLVATEYLREARAGLLLNMPQLVVIINRWPSIKHRLDLSDKEFIDLARRYNVGTAMRVIEEFRGGSKENLPTLARILEQGELTAEDLGMTQKGFAILVTMCVVDKGERIMEACRKGDFSDLMELLKSFDRGDLTPDSIGATKAELRRFRQDYFAGLMNQIAAQCRKDDFRNLKSLKAMFDEFAKKDESPAKLDFTVDDLESWRRKAELLGANLTPSRILVA